MTFALGQRARNRGDRLTAYEAHRLDQCRSDDAPPAPATAGRTGSYGRADAGRGRRQRPWETPPGNLAVSILETVDVPPAMAATLGFVAGLALDAALRATASGIDVASVLDGAGQGDCDCSR